MASTITRREAKDFKYGDPPASVSDPNGLAQVFKRMLYRNGEARVVASREEEAEAREDGWADHAVDLARQRDATEPKRAPGRPRKDAA